MSILWPEETISVLSLKMVTNGFLSSGYFFIAKKELCRKNDRGLKCSKNAFVKLMEVFVVVTWTEGNTPHILLVVGSTIFCK